MIDQCPIGIRRRRNILVKRRKIPEGQFNQTCFSCNLVVQKSIWESFLSNQTFFVFVSVFSVISVASYPKFAYNNSTFYTFTVHILTKAAVLDLLAISKIDILCTPPRPHPRAVCIPPGVRVAQIENRWTIVKIKRFWSNLETRFPFVLGPADRDRSNLFGGVGPLKVELIGTSSGSTLRPRDISAEESKSFQLFKFCLFVGQNG